MVSRLNIKIIIALASVMTICIFSGDVRALLSAIAADNSGVSVISPSEGQAFNQTTVEVTGSAEPSVSIGVYLNESAIGTTVSNADGSWAYQLDDLLEGNYTLCAASDSLGNVEFSNRVNFAIDLTEPDVIITNPVNDSYVNMGLIEGETEPELPVTVFVYGREATVIADTNGYWYYLGEDLPEGQNQVYASAVDKAGNSGTSTLVSFTLDMTRPTVSTTVYPPDVMTRVYWNEKIAFQLLDESPIDQTNMNSAILLNEVNSVDGTIYRSVYGSVYFNATNNWITFTPAEPLQPNQKYRATLNPQLADIAGNLVHPRSVSFTVYGNQDDFNPHGNYIENVNMCKNCHTTHRGQDAKLSFPLIDGAATLENYCNACHDGTVAPIPEKWPMPYNHNFKTSIDGAKGVNSCGSCHNPHLTWTEENPNLLQDFYYYDHNDPTNPYLPKSTEEAMCEACHDATIRDDTRVGYKRYQYKRNNSSTGSPEDYSLCLRCHNGSLAVNIAVYYDGQSRHSITAQDASMLTGHIACSDCHETHGSNNIKLLKEELGHNFVDKDNPFRASEPGWDYIRERHFCTRCHNNYTELYGITVGLDYGISGHESTSTEYCSTCHGGSPIAAAHAPN